MLNTERPSNHDNLEKKSTRELLQAMNLEDQQVAMQVEKTIPQIEPLVDQIIEKMRAGGRLFYIGAGTSGRLGILDASEIPPTFGLSHDRVIGMIAGGDGAIRKAVEFAEDDQNQAWLDLKKHDIHAGDVLIGIAASGTTPYVIGGIKMARAQKLVTGCITCNPGSPLAEVSEYPIEVNVGPEFVTGSTRLKSGTAQKLTLNMISTVTMIKLGHVKGNKMIDLQMSNDKLVDRAARIVMEDLQVSRSVAEELIQKHGSVRAAIDNYE